ncbi:BrnT family toxin [Massilia sp. CFBP9026]|uniref:BrnT family toxin n=1 Tax=Massilia sp. CFBP9026 TaxID=3096536 RepID=UPI002A6AB777|nr:BrnT family toxin [Massilia sp. CFBP9026]MDY0961722.1 BrnT family toxin [Massilia sp. CFBP9026]
MDIVYDVVKSESNTAKHGISLAEAMRFEWDDALIWNDERKHYGEARLCAIGYIDLRLYYIVYVLRDDVRRIISLRKANSREVKRYAQA